MDFLEYNEKAMRTVNPKLKWEDLVVMAAMGLAGEAGEIADHVKKWKFHDHKLDEKHLAKESGDVLWYNNLLADLLGMSLEEIAEMNIDKLKKRYPDKFSSEASINRLE